jgi:hypothetical protein
MYLKNIVQKKYCTIFFIVIYSKQNNLFKNEQEIMLLKFVIFKTIFKNE